MRSTTIHAALLVLACTISSTAFGAKGDVLDRSSFALSFSEDFRSGLSLYDPTTAPGGRWKTNWFYGDQAGPSSRRANDDVYVAPAYDGAMPYELQSTGVSINMTPTPDPLAPLNDGAHMTSGILTTELSFSQTYGYFEARLTLPGSQGTWPAFWLYSSPIGDWCGGLNDEIDVLEGQGREPRATWHSMHKRFDWVTEPGGERVVHDVAQSTERRVVDTRLPHVYGIKWTKSRLTWYIDDREVAHAANPGFNGPMYMILSLGSGGWDDNAVAPGFAKAIMKVDYVHAYTLTDGR